VISGRDRRRRRPGSLYAPNYNPAFIDPEVFAFINTVTMVIMVIHRRQGFAGRAPNRSAALIFGADGRVFFFFASRSWRRKSAMDPPMAACLIGDFWFVFAGARAIVPVAGGSGWRKTFRRKAKPRSSRSLFFSRTRSAKEPAVMAQAATALTVEQVARALWAGVVALFRQ